MLLIAELAVFAFRAPEKPRWASTPVMKLAVPSNGDKENSGGSLRKSGKYQYTSQPERLKGAVEQLSFSDGTCGIFDSGGRSGRSIDFFYLEYEAGNPSYIDDIFGHAPEVCMSAAGAKLRQKHPERTIQVGDYPSQVDVLEFEVPITGATLWIFKLTWVPDDAPLKPGSGVLRKDKILAGFLLKARPPARLLLAGARNYEDLDAAWEAFEVLIGDRLYFEEPAADGIKS